MPRRKKSEMDQAVEESRRIRESPEYQAQQANELAETVRKWRESAALPVSRAAQLLGIPKRTLEGIEQGRGFRYPILLSLAIMAFGEVK